MTTEGAMPTNREGQGMPAREEGRTPTREEGRTLLPPVDIFEMGDNLVVVADLPGVAKDDLRVDVDNGVLTIHGAVRPQQPGTPLYSEYDLLNFHREFTLNDEIETEGIQAELKYGVLTVRLPKADRARKRKIDVKVT